MSKQSFINGDALDFSILRTVMKDSVSSLLQEIEGSKCIVLDMSLSKSINIVLEGASVFKENNVVTFTKLSEEAIQTDANAVVFICKAEMKVLNLVVKVLNNLRNKNDNLTFHLFLVPRKTQVCVDYLRDNKVIDFITIRELEIDMIPIDNDLLSLESSNTFTDLYINDDETILKTLAEALLKLEIVYGPFSQIDGLGSGSRDLLNLLQEITPSHALSNDIPSKINRLILFDRKVDLASLFVTPLTYEALINEFLNFDCGALSIQGTIVGKKETSIVSVPLNSNDTLFSEIANYNISVVPRYLKEKSNEIQALYNSRPKDSSCSISEMNQFVKKVGTIQELSDSLQVHLGIADQLLQYTNSPDFGQQWQLERELLEGENIIETIKNMFMEENSLETILHYLILYSIINNGIKSKDYDSIRREILLMFGFQYLPLLTSLEKAKLLTRRDNSNNYSVLKGKLRLIRNDVDGTQPIDINYVTSGYAPISARMIQGGLFNTSPLSEIAKAVNCDYVHKEQETMTDSSNNNTLIVFIGGVTFLEISAIRLLKKLNPSIHFTILTTDIVKGNDIVKGLCDDYRMNDNAASSSSHDQSLPNPNVQNS